MKNLNPIWIFTSVKKTSVDNEGEYLSDVSDSYQEDSFEFSNIENSNGSDALENVPVRICR